MDQSKLYNNPQTSPAPIDPRTSDPRALLTLKDDPRYQGTPAQVISEDLNYLLDEIVRCDDTYCYDLRDMVFEAIQLVLSHHDPKTMREIVKCTGIEEMNDECTDLYADAFARYNLPVFQMIEQRRQEISPDPLDNYDGTLYESPFWFSHSGDIWRRVTHESKRVNVEKDCEKLLKLSDRCLKDDKMTHKECLDIYSNALACAPGAYCPYLRQPLMTCMHGSGINDYEQMRECMTKIPNYHSCERGYVSPPPKTKPVKPLLDLRI